MGLYKNKENGEENNDNYNPYILFLILILLILSEDILQMINVLLQNNKRDFKILPAPAKSGGGEPVKNRINKGV